MFVLMLLMKLLTSLVQNYFQYEHSLLACSQSIWQLSLHARTKGSCIYNLLLKERFIRFPLYLEFMLKYKVLALPL